MYKKIKETNQWGSADCEFCGGTGEVETMDYVYRGEPHMAPIGVQDCICVTGRHCDDETDEFLSDKERKIPCKEK